MPAHRRYRSAEEDSGRWDGFRFRSGDIVISTRSKSGTTWMQMICALLVHRSAELPQPLHVMSPWLDWLVEPREAVIARLEAQPHRRLIKTHTPLDGLPLDDRATYIVVGRHPLDMAVSLYHQGDNIDRARLAAATGAQPAPAVGDRPPFDEWFHDWLAGGESPQEQLDSLPGIMWHLRDAWSRRAAPNVVLVHYADLEADLPGEMGRLTARIGERLTDAEISELARAARFEAMRARSDETAPGGGVMKSSAAFFRRGRSGAAVETLTPADLAVYEDRTRRLASPDLLAWLHR